MFITLVKILVTALFFAFLVVGLMQSRKHSFKAGFYFFLILIVHHFLSLFYPPLIRRYVVSLSEGGNSPPIGMTIGELLTWLSLLPHIINLIAFGILVAGLYNMWNSRTPFRR